MCVADGRLYATFVHTIKEGLIYSRFHPAVCSCADHQGEFGGHLLVRSLFVGAAAI
jgi:hypothetical protein